MATMVVYSDDIYHSGIKGMKWGQRRYQNEDGSLTPAGRERYRRMYGVSTREEVDSLKARNAQYLSDLRSAGSRSERRAARKSYMEDTNYRSRKKTRLAAKGKRLAKGVAKTAAVGAGLAAVGLVARSNYNRRLHRAMDATDAAWRKMAEDRYDESQREKEMNDIWERNQAAARDRSNKQRVESLRRDIIRKNLTSKKTKGKASIR